MASTTIAQPNATLYVKNIDWKIKKPLLRRALYSLFSRHGKVRSFIRVCVCVCVPQVASICLLDLFVLTVYCTEHENRRRTNYTNSIFCFRLEMVLLYVSYYYTTVL